MYINNKNFLIGLIGISILGSFYLYKNFAEYQEVKNSSDFQMQVDDLRNQISEYERKISEVMEEVNKKKPLLGKVNSNIIENYMSIIKELHFIKRNNPFINNITIKTIQTRTIDNFDYTKNKLNNGTLLTEQLSDFEENPNIKKLDLSINISLNDTYAKLSNDKTNFLVYYRPLAYIYYILKNKPAIIKKVLLSKNSYNINITLIGKK